MNELTPLDPLPFSVTAITMYTSATPQLGSSIDVRGIRPGVRFRQGKSTKQLSPRHRREILLFLSLCAEMVDYQLRKPVDRKHAAQMTAQPREFFKHGYV